MQAVNRLQPLTIDRISQQIAQIGWVICNFLGHRLSVPDLMCLPEPVARRGPSGEELERRIMMWGRSKQRIQEQGRVAHG